MSITPGLRAVVFLLARFLAAKLGYPRASGKSSGKSSGRSSDAHEEPHAFATRALDADGFFARLSIPAGGAPPGGGPSPPRG